MEDVGSAPGTDPSQQPVSSANHQDDDGKNDPNKKANVRKRTKTGCLTCRKRRIKCDEGRPTCNNCLKSKRQCEGYNQRVVFKDPMSAVQGGPFGSAHYSPGSSQAGGQFAPKPSQVPLAPKPPSSGLRDRQVPQQYGQYRQHPISPTAYGARHPPQMPALYPQQANHLISLQTPTTYFGSEHDVRPSNSYPAPPHSVASGSQSQQDRQTAPNVFTEQSRSSSFPSDAWDYDIPDDDAGMADSDDDEKDPRVMLGPVVRQFNGAFDAHGTRLRAFSTFAQSNVLKEYTASAHMSEFKDPRMLAIFMHFIRVTGPTMSLFERHPFDSSGEFDFGLTPGETNHLWSYTFPLVSFNHPALLHAMLALASLQIANLQKAPATAAMKHYHLAIRRVARNVRTTARRTQPPTLAATLLLAYFEVWSSDHTKWCNHLFGARILLREIPLIRMTKRCLPVQRLRQQKKELDEQGTMHSFFPEYQIPPKNGLIDLDYGFLQAVSGQDVTAETYGLGENQAIESTGNPVTDRDIEQYETLRDLYWWYCKMDVYQSMLGGTKLFMEYELWTQVPPRAPMSKLEVAYGTYDHLMLLLGRLANFASKDVTRKRKVARAKAAAPAGVPSPPSFPGLMPTTGKFNVPMGFTPPRDSSPQSEGTDEADLDAAYLAALKEWETIKQALETFEKSLGPEFQPLRPEFSDRRESPFGMSLQYRTFSVAGVWMNLYMGIISLYRSHPSMPPAAQQAVGMAAQHTGKYANFLGRVAAGLSDDCSQVTEISTLVSAAFIESCFCLFVAAVEYRDDNQRHWVIQRMLDINRLTGWQSARQIADGCESGWVKASQLGRGPPYVRRTEKEFYPTEPIWQSPRRIDREIKTRERNEEQRVVLAKSERTSYALGLLGVERDLEVLELKDEG